MIRSPGFEIGAAPALGDEVDPLGGAADEDDLVGRGGADEAGDPPPRRLEGERHLRRALVDAAMDGRIGLGIAAVDRVDHRQRLLRGRGGVEIGPALRDRREVGDMVERAGGGGHVHQPSQPSASAWKASRTFSSPTRSIASATKARVSRRLGVGSGTPRLAM